MGRYAQRCTGTMLGAIANGRDWNTQTLGGESFGLGWTGWREPAVARRGNLTAVVDGLFYNLDEACPDQDQPGNRDAQALLALVERYGFESALQRLNGDFAVAVYDERERTLWLGRDRVGVKPMYYSRQPGFFAFGSRPMALLAAGVDKSPNQRFVALFAGSHYRTFDNDPEASPYEHISQLPAGHALRYADGQAKLIRYWSLENQPDWDASEDELAERYRDLLLDSVSKRFKRAVSPAFTLSGGMDSSSVLASAVRMSGHKQLAYSTVYEDKTYDESDEIRSMLDTTVSEWRPVTIGQPRVFEQVEDLIAQHDEPIATATWLSHSILCRQASAAGIRGLFGGLGGDELNAGEYEYFLFHFADLRRAGKEDTLQEEIRHWVRYHDHPIYKKNAQVVENGFKRMVDFGTPGRCLPDAARIGRYAPALAPELSPGMLDVAGFTPVMDTIFDSYLKNRTYQDIFREAAPCCLRAEDRQTTAVGMDHFDPFYDYRLLEFMFRVPGTMKIRDGVTKTLLRKAMAGVLPEETRTRVAKTGWNAPAHVWFSGKGQEQLLDMVNSQAFRQRGVYNADEVLRLAAEHQEVISSGRAAENHMMFFWQLVNLETWLNWLDNLSVGQSPENQQNVAV